MWDIFTYCRCAAAYPDKRDYLKRGLGIAARWRRCRTFWAPHLRLCKQFQMDALTGKGSAGALAVLGAGRLLDIEQSLLLNNFEQVDLFDADPGALSAWKALARQTGPNRKIAFRVEDITSTIEIWTKGFQSFLSSQPRNDERLCAFLSALDTSAPAFREMKYDAIYSINLLSQIPIFWRDRAHRLMKCFWKINPTELPEGVDQALGRSMRALERSHIAALDSSGAELILLITDIEIFYYQRDQARWESEVVLDAEAVRFRNFDQTRMQHWYWHILPQGPESRGFGAIHRVAAYEFRAKNLK